MSSEAKLADCPLCHLAAVLTTHSQVEHSVACAHCGHFAMSDTIRVLLAKLPSRLLVGLSAATWSANANGKPIKITVQNIAELVAPYV